MLSQMNVTAPTSPPVQQNLMNSASGKQNLCFVEKVIQMKLLVAILIRRVVVGVLKSHSCQFSLKC